VGKVYKVGAMAGIARNIELYNLAYNLAWKHISEHQKHERPDILKAFEESERGTPKAESAKPDSRLSRHN